MRRWLFLSLLGVIILASCNGVEAPSEEDFNYCYTYDFASRDFTFYDDKPLHFGFTEPGFVAIPGYAEPELVYETVETETGPIDQLVSGGHFNAAMPVGSWVTTAGFVNDDDDDLKVRFWTIPHYNPPDLAVLSAVIELQVPAAVDIQATGHIFGLPVLIDETYLGDAGVLLYPISNPTNTVIDDEIEIEIQASAAIAIRGVKIYQRGPDVGVDEPAILNECGDATPTPTNTVTPLPTETSTATATSTPSDTPEPDPYSCDGETLEGYTWMECFPVSVYRAGWIITSAAGSWTAGQGFEDGESCSMIGAVCNNRTRDIRIVNDWSGSSNFTFQKAKVIFSYTAGSSAGGANNWLMAGTTNGTLWNNTTAIDAPPEFIWTGAGTSIGHGLQLYARVCRTANHYPSNAPTCNPGTITIHKIVVWGSGTEPTWNTEATPTPTTDPSTATLTPSLTSTLTATSTRTPLFGGGGDPTATRTNTRTPIGPVHSPSPITPTITLTPAPSLPPPTAPPSSTFVPQPTALPSQTIEATHAVPGNTAIPNSTEVIPADAMSTLAGVDGHSAVYNFLATAVVEVNNLPGDFGPYVPNPDISPLLGYAKWFLSCSTAQELVGQNVGLMLCHSAVGLSLIVILSAVVMSVRIITLVMKFAVWIFKKIIDLIPFI